MLNDITEILERMTIADLASFVAGVLSIAVPCLFLLGLGS